MNSTNDTRGSPSTPRRFELIALDLVGTTADDGGIVASTFATVLEPFGVEVNAEALAPLRGASKREAIERLLAGRLGETEAARGVDVAMATFDARLGDAYANGLLREIPGAGDVLHALRQRGHRVALCSGLPRRLVDLILARLGWSAHIDASVAGDEVSRGRPAPYLLFRAMEQTGATDVRRVMAVGDTEVDMQAGARAGCGAVVGVLSGAHDAEQLRRHAPTHVLPSVADLPALLDSLAG